MIKKPSLLIIASIYFIIAGTSLLSHVFYPQVDLIVKKNLYHVTQKNLKEIEDIRMRSHFLSEDHIVMFEKHSRELLRVMRDFRRKRIVFASFQPLGMSALGVLLGIVYFSAGIALIKKRLAAKKIASFGFMIWFIYCIFFMWNAVIEMQYLDYTSLQFWQMASFFQPDMGHLNYRSLMKPLMDFTTVRIVVFIFVWITVYLLLPLYFLMRPKVTGCLKP